MFPFLRRGMLPRMLSAAATGGQAGPAELIGEEFHRRRPILPYDARRSLAAFTIPISASALKPSLKKKDLLMVDGSASAVKARIVPPLGMVGVYGRRGYSHAAANEEGRGFITTRYLTPAGKKIDTLLRGMGFVPRGPYSRVFLLVFLYGCVSCAVRATVEITRALSKLVQIVWDHSSWDEALVCELLEVFSTAMVDDASGWA